MNATTSSEEDQEKEIGRKKQQASKRRKRQRDDLFNQTFLSSRAGSLSLTNRIPFPTKLFQMLEDLENAGKKSIASWSSDGKSFRVHDTKTFVDSVMPHYFRQSKFKSFQRQLHLYGFTRITDGSHKGSYFHPAFLRSNRELCKDMMPLKRVKRDDELEDSQQEAPSLSSRRSQDGHASHADDEGSQGGLLDSRKNLPKKKQSSHASSRGGAAAASVGSKEQASSTIAQTVALNDNIQERRYHDKSPIMYFPPENQMLSSSLLPFSYRGGPAVPGGGGGGGGGVIPRPMMTQPSSLQSSEQPQQQESRIIAYSSSLSSDEDGKKAAIDRTGDGSEDNAAVNIVSAHQDSQQRFQHQRVSLLPDPSNPSGMVALENQFYLPLDRLIALPEGPRRTGRGPIPQTDPATSTSFLPQLSSSFTSLATRGTLVPLNESHLTPRYPTEQQQQTVRAAALSRLESSSTQSFVENKQQEFEPAPSPLLSVIQQLPSRSTLLDGAYREQILHAPQLQGDERGGFLQFLNQSQPQHQLTTPRENPIQPLGNATTSAQSFNNVPTTSDAAVTNMVLTLQQQMNETYLLALLQQQQEEQQRQILAQYYTGEIARQMPRNDEPGVATGLSTTNTFSTALPPFHTPAAQHDSSERNSNPAAPLVSSSVALFNFQDPPPPTTTTTTNSRPNSAASNNPYLAPPPFMFPPEQQHHRQSSLSTTVTSNSSLMIGGGSNTLLSMAGDHSTSGMIMNTSFHHNPRQSSQNDDEERLCLPPPPPPPTAPPPSRRSSNEGGGQHNQQKSAVSRLYTTSGETSNTSTRVEEVLSNSHHAELERTTSQQQQQTQQRERIMAIDNPSGGQQGGLRHEAPQSSSSSLQHHEAPPLNSDQQQQDVSPANSGTSFDSTLFEPNPFYQ